MFTYTIYNSFKKVKKIWTNLFQLCNATPYQNEEMIKSVNSFAYYLLTKSKIYFFLINNDKDPVAIIPYRKNGSNIYILGTNESFNFCDIVYNPLLFNLESFLFFISTIKILKIKNIIWQRVRTDSKSFELIDKLNKIYAINKTINHNVRIYLNNSFDNYFSLLSKSTRQNIRTAYNRLEKNNISFSHKIFFAQNNDYPLFKDKIQCLKLYNKRLKNKYYVSLVHRLFRLTLYQTVKTVYSKQFGFSSIFYINNKVAGFMQGYLDKYRKTIFIPKLSINEKFKFYSPGYLLIIETIKKLFNEEIEYLDLTIGTEKYKLDLSGTIYISYNYNISL